MSRTQITTNSLKDASVTPEKLIYPFNFSGSTSALSSTVANLTVTGSISAAQYLGLPPSGGEVNIIELSVFL